MRGCHAPTLALLDQQHDEVAVKPRAIASTVIWHASSDPPPESIAPIAAAWAIRQDEDGHEPQSTVERVSDRRLVFDIWLSQPPSRQSAIRKTGITDV
jgi:hypothetical protein